MPVFICTIEINICYLNKQNLLRYKLQKVQSSFLQNIPIRTFLTNIGFERCVLTLDSKEKYSDKGLIVFVVSLSLPFCDIADVVDRFQIFFFDR